MQRVKHMNKGEEQSINERIGVGVLISFNLANHVLPDHNLSPISTKLMIKLLKINYSSIP